MLLGVRSHVFLLKSSNTWDRNTQASCPDLQVKMISAESEKRSCCNQLLAARCLSFPPCASRQKPSPTFGSNCRPINENKVRLPSETLLADQKKKKGIKFNCRVGVFLKRLSGCRELNILSLHNYSLLSKKKRKEEVWGKNQMNSKIASSLRCLGEWNLFQLLKTRQLRHSNTQRLQRALLPLSCFFPGRQHYPRPPALPSYFTFPALKNADITMGTGHSLLPADPHQLISIRVMPKANKAAKRRIQLDNPCAQLPVAGYRGKN